jgi:hypothetical protein
MSLIHAVHKRLLIRALVLNLILLVAPGSTLAQPGADAADNPCAVWTLPLLRDRNRPDDLLLRLEHDAAAPSTGAWAFYAFVLPETPSAPIPRLSVSALNGVDPVPTRLQTQRLQGSHRPAYRIRDWYLADPERPRLHHGLYLLRLPGPDTDLDRLGLAIAPYNPGPPLRWGISKHHGPLPQLVLELKPVAAEGFGPRALLCRARSPER